MNVGVLLISFIICAVGLTLAFVYFNPFGLIIDGLGFMLFIVGIKIDSEKATVKLWRFLAMESAFSGKIAARRENAQTVGCLETQVVRGMRSF